MTTHERTPGRGNYGGTAATIEARIGRLRELREELREDLTLVESLLEESAVALRAVGDGSA